MKIFGALFGRGRVVRGFKDQWEKANRRKVLDTGIPESVQKLGIQVEDAREVANPVVQLPTIEVPEPYNLIKPAPLREHRLWKDKICLFVHGETRLLEGLSQAQVLTNTIVRKGLAPQIENLIGEREDEQQDEGVKRFISQSHIFDGFQTKLPKRIIINAGRLSKPEAREYGIPHQRKIMLLVRNLLRFMELQSNSYDGLMDRANFHDSKVFLTVTKDEELLQFCMKLHLLVSSKKPLEPFANEEEVAALRGAEFPDIYPVKWSIDIPKINVYDEKLHFPLKNVIGSPNHPHTIYMYDVQHRKKYKESQSLAKALFTCYAVAAAQARNRFGSEVKKLPQPIVVQCVQTTGRLFQFVSFQLNTLDLDSSCVERNLAYVEGDTPMYESCSLDDRQVLVHGYNSDVYENLLAMNINGLTLNDDGKKYQYIFNDLQINQ
ncbi:39S ribosomal protein L37, mitochondrial [Chamberlinius hualienensis]